MLPTSESVRALAARLVSRELVLFPVRHHSPACSWHLQRLLAEMRPSAVLVEGPRSFYVAHSAAGPPRRPDAPCDLHVRGIQVGGRRGTSATRRLLPLLRPFS